LNKAYLSLFVFLFDLSAVVFAWGGGFLLRFNFDVPANFVSVMSWGLVFLLPTHVVACRLAGLYRGIWMFASLPDLKRVLLAVGFSTSALLLFYVLYRNQYQVVPRSLLVLYPLLLAVYMGRWSCHISNVEGTSLVWWLDCYG
jgi:FlaA1/EpsC-like NDP-sugar epimerase